MSLCLCMVLGSVLISFFYTKLTSFCCTIYWRDCLFSTPSPAFIVCRHFDDAHSDRCDEISHCSFALHFSSNEWCWSSFPVFVSHLSGELSVYVFFPLLDWVVCFLALSYVSCFHILKINPLSVVSFAIIFIYSEGCLFTLFMVFFAVQKLLSLIRPHLFIFVFISITLGGGS